MSEQSKDGWQDIASAPKDGTWFLWCFDNGEYAKLRWTYCVIRWPDFDDCFDAGYWQPLPTPPAKGD